MVRAAIMSALMAVCAWISVPVMDIAFTLQTFAIFLSLGLLGGKWGTVSIGIYLLLGAVGLPVFSGFRGGPGVLLGVTGGYIWGFLLSGLVYWSFEKLCKPVGMGLGLAVCYLCGSLWFCVYAGDGGFAAAVVRCVLPFLIPDAVKLALAWGVSRRLGKYVR